MTTPQQPIASGFGMRSTATEVLSGIDLTDKQVIVTGGYSGVGLETTRVLAHAGARVLVAARRLAHANEEIGHLDAGRGKIDVDELDLSDLQSVRGFATRCLESFQPVDILINNAGVMACPETRVGPGWEAQFATNHLGHFALTCLLWPALTAGAGGRVVSLSSLAHRRSAIRWDDPMWESEIYDRWRAYGQAKTANSLFAVHLDVIGKRSGVRAFAVHPGAIMTPLSRYMAREEMVASGWMDEKGTLSAHFKTPEQGASTSAWVATSPKLDGMGGVYCENCNIATPTDAHSPTAGVEGVYEHAVDLHAASRLWKLSTQLTGVDVPSAV